MPVRMLRKDVPVEQTWNLESLYAGLDAWESDFARVEAELASAARFRGRLGEGAGALSACLALHDQVKAAAERIRWFAANRLAEDMSQTEWQACAQRASALVSAVAAAFAFLEPEILALPGEKVTAWIQSDAELKPYQGYLQELYTRQAHSLSPDAEAVLAELGESLNTPLGVWRTIVSQELQFSPVSDADGTPVPMSLAAVYRLLKSPVRGVRRAAYESATTAFGAHTGTLALVFAAACRRNVALARLRRYPSALEGALQSEKLPAAMVDRLLAAAEQGACLFQRYLACRKRTMRVDDLMPWDLYSPLGEAPVQPVSFSEGFQTVVNALAPLGPEYRAVLEQARRERWIDCADNAGKRSDAFCSWCYGHHPGVMMTWQGTAHNILTLAHELGHAVHWYLSGQSQPYRYAFPSLFLSEMAAIVNEVLLIRYLLQSEEPALRSQVLVTAVDSLTQNFFWGSMTTAFQVRVHAMAERGEPLTYESITRANTETLQRWHGAAMAVTTDGDGSTWTWLWQNFSHFYSYQYPAGAALAFAVAEMVLDGGTPAVENYRRFLGAGSSADSTALLGNLGLDLTAPTTYDRFLTGYAGLVDELERT